MSWFDPLANDFFCRADVDALSDNPGTLTNTASGQEEQEITGNNLSDDESNPKRTKQTIW